MKHILTALLFFLFGCACEAQFVKSIGISGGTSFANQKWDFTDTYAYPVTLNRVENIPCFFSKITFEFIKKKYYSFNIDFGYHKYKVEMDYSVYTADLFGPFPLQYYYVSRHDTAKFNHLEFSPEIKIEIPFHQFSISYIAGIKVNYLFSEHHDFYNADMNHSNIGLVTGFGIEYRIQKSHLSLMLDVLYHYEFNNVLTYSTPKSSLKIQNKEIYVLSGGIKYNFSKTKTQ